MEKTYINKAIVDRFDELIAEGQRQWKEFKNNENGMIMDIISFTRWSTSSLNLLDKLSISTNRFVKQFENWAVGCRLFHRVIVHRVIFLVYSIQ